MALQTWLYFFFFIFCTSNSTVIFINYRLLKTLKTSWKISLSYNNILTVKWSEMKSLSSVWPFVTPWTVAYQAPLSMELSRQEYCNRLPFSFPQDLPNPGIKPGSPTLQADALPFEPPGKPILTVDLHIWKYFQKAFFWTWIKMAEKENMKITTLHEHIKNTSTCGTILTEN